MVSWLLPHSCNAAYLFSTLALSLLPLFTNKSAQGVSYGGLSSNVDEVMLVSAMRENPEAHLGTTAICAFR
jgi:hypothetical protein